MEFLSPEGLRMDGRRPKELRKLHCEVGTLGEADGSATFDMGNTKVTAPGACHMHCSRLKECVHGTSKKADICRPFRRQPRGPVMMV